MIAPPTRLPASPASTSDERLVRLLTREYLRSRPAGLRYGIAVASVAVATNLRWLLIPRMDEIALYAVILMAQVIATVFLGIGPALLTVFLGDLAVEVFVLGSFPQMLAGISVLRLGTSIAMGIFACLVLNSIRVALTRASKSEARLAAFAEASFEGIVESDAGRILDCNEQFARIAGRTVPELRGLSIIDVVAPEDRDRVAANIRENRESMVEHAVLQKDGARLIVEAHGRPMSPDSLRRITCVRDITARKQVEEALRDSQLRLEAKVRERTAELVQANEQLKIENQERIRTEQSLRLEESRLDALLHLSQMTDVSLEEICSFTLEQAIALTNSKIGFIGFLDDRESVFTLHAVSREVLKSCGVADSPTHWSVREGGMWADAVRERRTVFVNDYTTPHPSKKGLPPGHPVLGNLMIVPSLDSGRVVVLAGVANKDSDYNRSDERQVALLLNGMWSNLQKNRAREELRDHALQLRALAGELTLSEQRERRRMAKVLHDHLQQLLVGAKFRVTILGRAGDELVRQGAQEVEELLDESIDASRSLTAELSPPILHEAGLDVGLEWLARWMGDKHGLFVDLDVEDEPTPLAEDVKIFLFQSIRELLFNSVKHAHTRSASVSVRHVNGSVQVVVSDQGSGFDPNAIPRAGEKGGGFGLFSIRERLDLIGGKLEIESAPGKGSRFILTAPIAEPAAARAESPAAAASFSNGRASAGSPAPGARIRVLLADDHVVMREGLARLLGHEPDIEVVGQAADGQEAVELAAKLIPDVILMDVSMPRLNGVEATRAIRNDHPDIHIIGLSMFDEADRAEALRDAGASDYLTKSGPPEELIAAIRRCMSARV